jgi:hypothetical protein
MLTTLVLFAALGKNSQVPSMAIRKTGRSGHANENAERVESYLHDLGISAKEGK